MKQIIFIIGVSGSGKSTIGKLLSQKVSIPFFDGDDFHPKYNIDKMASGKALNDDDRKGWLNSLNQHAIKCNTLDGAIIACSALKESYRDILKTDIEGDVKWVFLKGNKSLIQSRIEARTGHFMSSSLLQSQFDALEIPNYGLHLDILETPEILITTIIKELNL
jgi:6-phosphogluconate dehydrogenase